MTFCPAPSGSRVRPSVLSVAFALLAAAIINYGDFALVGTGTSGTLLGTDRSKKLRDLAVDFRCELGLIRFRGEPLDRLKCQTSGIRPAEGSLHACPPEPRIEILLLAKR